MKLQNADGTTTWYEEYGDPQNPTMVLLHGIGADHRMWQPQIERYPNEGYHVLAMDMLGHGKSSKVKSLTLQDWHNQINDLLQAKGVDRCILMGVSMGGVIALSYVAQYPEKVARLIVSDTFGELKTFQARMVGVAAVFGFRVYKLLGPKMLANGMASTYKAPFAQDARTYFEAVSLEVDFDQLVLARKAINQIDILDQLRTLSMPSLVMAGDQFGTWFVEMNKNIAAALQGSHFVEIPQSMDPSNLVNPAAFDKAVLEFLH